jgi:glycosyltransferase involved in cell wall biosynthesis
MTQPTEGQTVGISSEAESAGAGLVSVVIPSYNHAKFVSTAIESVFRQTYRPIELIILDDGSSDGSDRAIRKAIEGAPIPVTYETQSNMGVARTLNKGIGMSRGSWISLLASDDYYYPEKTEAQVIAARKTGAKLVVSWAPKLRPDGSLAEYPREEFRRLREAHGRAALKRYMLDNITGFTWQAILAHRTFFEAAGGYDPAIYTEDFDFSLRATTLADRDIAFLDLPVAIHRERERARHPREVAERGRESQLQVLRKHSASWRERRIGMATIDITHGVWLMRHGHVLGGVRRLVAGAIRDPFNKQIWGSISRLGRRVASARWLLPVKPR